MSKEGPTQTSTQSTSLPPHITQAQIDLIKKATGLIDPFLQTPNQGVMGLMPDQIMSSLLANEAAQYASQNLKNPIKAYDVFGMGNQWQQPGGVPVAIPQAAAGSGATAGTAAAQQAASAQAQAQQLAPGEISPFMNPYINTALNPVLERLKQQQKEVQSGIGANAAASNMFGGSREAVMRMLADRNYRDTLGTTAGNMLHAGWQTASGLASQNADRRQQTALTNAQLQNAINALNAQLGTQASISNAGFGTQAGIANAQLGTQASIANAQLGTQSALQNQNLMFQGAQSDANRFLTALGLQNQIDTSGLNNQFNAINTLSNLGNQQRAVGQQALDLPFTRLNDLLKTTGSLSGGSTTNTTSTSEKPIDWASILTGGLGLLPFFSDREDKTDIKRLGKDPSTGVDMYAYRYKGDPKSYPKVVGPMAQDLEKAMPGITRLVGRHRIVG